MNSEGTRRIIITGASGVGKTTLVEALTPLLSLPVIPELARDICKQLGYATICDVPDQEEFKKTVLKAQIEKEEELGSFLADRSALDFWVLWQRWNICTAMSYDTETYYNQVTDQSQKYTHIIYVPPMFPPVDDGFRWTDLDYQKQIDRLTRMTIYELDLWERTLTLTPKDTSRRAEAVLAWLEDSLTD
jgi:hypothetical protein